MRFLAGFCGSTGEKLTQAEKDGSGDFQLPSSNCQVMSRMLAIRPMNQGGLRYNQYSMASSPLQDALRAQATDPTPLRESDYRGAITAAVFSDVQQEFTALTSGCGVYDLGFRARISLKGGDRVRWMNGMVTNNIRDLATGQGVYAFLLNPQGRILGDMNVYNLGETLEVETDRSQLEKILATFDHYIIMDDVEVTNISEEWTALGVAGPKSRAVLKAAGIVVPELRPLQTHVAQCQCECDCVECTVVRGEDERRESLRNLAGAERCSENLAGVAGCGCDAGGQ